MPTTQQQKSRYQHFSRLHRQDSALVLINIWDAASAVIMESQGAQALATSSASLAWSLGYPDGNQLPKSELLAAIARILRVTKMPLSVDIETGYSDNPDDVASLARELHEMGVSGINIEDGSEPPALLAEKIKAIKAAAPSLFINARTDVYLAGLVAEHQQFSETQKRLQLYQGAGADGVFVPGLLDTAVANELQTSCPLPLNLMAMEEAHVASFNKTGIKRISMGPGSFLKAYQTLIQQPSGESALSPLTYAGLNSHLGGQ